MIDKISKFLICILLFITFSFINTEKKLSNNIKTSNKDIYIFYRLSLEYKWLTQELYYTITKYSKKYNVDKVLICALIQHESNGRNVRSRRNRNGSRDYGLMQINQIHSPKNIYALYNKDTNIRIGVWYLSKCLRKSRGNIKRACIFYNAGLNCNIRRYRNYKYIYRIYKSYSNSREILFSKNYNIANNMSI